MLQIALPLQNTDGGQNRVVGQGWLLTNRIKHLLDRTRSLEPEHIHNPQLGFGQSSRLSRRHRRPSWQIRRVASRKVTNSLVARENSRVAWLSERATTTRIEGGPLLAAPSQGVGTPARWITRA